MVAIALVHTCKHLRPVEGYRIESPTSFQCLLPAFVSWASYDAWALVFLSVNSGKAVPARERILGLNLVIHVKPRTPWLHMCKGGLLCKLGVCPMGKIQADSAIFRFHICKLKQLHTSASACRVTAFSAHPDHICAMTTTVSLTGPAGYSQLWAPCVPAACQKSGFTWPKPPRSTLLHVTDAALSTVPWCLGERVELSALLTVPGSSAIVSRRALQTLMAEVPC